LYDPTTSELERKRLQVAGELHKVEQQILDLETKYLEQSTAFGNAIRGYEGFLGGIGQAKNKNVPVKEEDRIFSMGMALK
jgi:chromatin modification-related protein EAF6